MATSTWTYWTSDTTATASTCNTNDAWVSWNTTSSSTVTTNNDTWYYWIVDSTTDGACRPHNVQTYPEYNEVWTVWNTEGTVKIYERDFSTPYVDKRRQRLKARRAERKRAKEHRKLLARRVMREFELQKAEEVAQELLLDLIGPEQMEVYKRTGRVFVKGRTFDWLLQTEGSRCKLKKITKDKVQDLCIHIDNDRIPKTDQVIGYLLNAKFNDEHLDKTANLIRVNEKTDFEDRIKDAAAA